MGLHFLKYYLSLLGLLLVTGASYAQSAQGAYYDSEIKEREIAKENWEQIIEGLDYSETEEKKKEEEEDDEANPTPTTSPSSGSSGSFPTGNNSAFWAGFFKVFFVLAIIAALVLLGAHFMGAGTFVNPKNRKFIKSDTTITIDNVEEHIYESDLDRFIREAAEQKNYSLAIRLYYLAIIKELSLNRTIHWKKDKTNRDYLREMRKTNLFQSFREATRVFERIWYGQDELEEAEYLKVKPKFEALVKAAQARQVTVNTV